MNSYKTVEKKVSYPEVGKLIVTAPLEMKIRTLIALYPSTEWSGIMFYKHTGSLRDKNLVVTAEDLYLMDIGTGGFTTFELGSDPSIASYMATHQLFDCHQALIHSHHSMGAFFSGTDTATLEKEGKTMPNFVSLVVDTAGTYVAAITSRISYNIKGKYTITTSEFGGTEYTEDSDKEYAKTISKVEIFGLSVEIEKVDTSLFDRIEELPKKKTPSYTSYTRYLNNDKEEEEEEKEKYKAKTKPKISYPLYDDLYGGEEDKDYPSLYGKLDDEEKLEDIIFYVFDSLTTMRVDGNFTNYSNDDWNELIASCVEAKNDFEWTEQDIYDTVREEVARHYTGEEDFINDKVIPAIEAIKGVLLPQVKKEGTVLIDSILKALKNDG